MLGSCTLLGEGSLLAGQWLWRCRRQGRICHTLSRNPALLRASQLVPGLSTTLLAPLAIEGKALSPPQFIFAQSRGEVTMVNWGGSCPRTDGHWAFPAQWAGERLGGYRLTQDINLQKLLRGKDSKLRQHRIHRRERSRGRAAGQGGR